MSGAATAETGPAAHNETIERSTPRGTGLCPFFHEAVELLGKRWTGAIVHTLLGGPMRFSELTHAIPQISDRLLSIRLRELEACGIVARQVSARPPVRVEYALTAKGEALRPAVTAIRSWACDWLQ